MLRPADHPSFPTPAKVDSSVYPLAKVSGKLAPTKSLSLREKDYLDDESHLREALCALSPSLWTDRAVLDLVTRAQHEEDPVAYLQASERYLREASSLRTVAIDRLLTLLVNMVLRRRDAVLPLLSPNLPEDARAQLRTASLLEDGIFGAVPPSFSSELEEKRKDSTMMALLQKTSRPTPVNVQLMAPASGRAATSQTQGTKRSHSGAPAQKSAPHGKSSAPPPLMTQQPAASHPPPQSSRPPQPFRGGRKSRGHPSKRGKGRGQ